MTKEHVFRNAYRRLHTDEVTNYRHKNLMSGDARNLRGKTPFEETQVKRVCAQCNNGWMNDLEVATEPTLWPMVHGKQTLVDAGSAQLLALWAVKTCMMRAFADPHHAVQQSDLKHVFANRRPPDHWRVFLGRTSSNGLAENTWWSQSLLSETGTKPKLGAEPNLHLQQHNLMIGDVFLSTIGCASTYGTSTAKVVVDLMTSEIQSTTTSQLLMLWPQPQQFTWPFEPPVPAAGFAMVGSAVERFARESPPLPGASLGRPVGGFLSHFVFPAED
ncbi:hypothetical protein CH251_10540 [Rhodococcus sp. 06-462-5]|nr:hypothetical protein CH251_10540 [Rhodococcus sp. 06-462-5]OZE67723.1 hypothetical protein CH270_08140 [Rhodococcus sp. 02-925g]